MTDSDGHELCADKYSSTRVACVTRHYYPGTRLERLTTIRKSVRIDANPREFLRNTAASNYSVPFNSGTKCTIITVSNDVKQQLSEKPLTDECRPTCRRHPTTDTTCQSMYTCKGHLEIKAIRQETESLVWVKVCIYVSRAI